MSRSTSSPLSAVRVSAVIAVLSTGLVLLPTSRPAVAQTQEEVRGLGFSAGGVYSTTDVDSVNLFNGNLTIATPIGQSYPASERLSYDLTLVHNSSAWSYVQWQDPNPPQDFYTSGLPEPSANAGLGWSLTFGRLVPPGGEDAAVDDDPVNDRDLWKLIDANGATHFFLDSLHPEEPSLASTSYTRDNSYLRMIEVSSIERQVQYPDGTVYTFEPMASPLDTRYWEVTSISNPFGNQVAIDRTNPWAWEITDCATDSEVRRHVVNFQVFPDSSTLPGPHVESVELAAFDGTRAVYAFEYGEVFVERGCQDSIPGGIPSETYPRTLKVPLLKRIVLPENESYAMVNPGPPETPAYSISCTNSDTGRLLHLVLPAGGRVEWEYDGYLLPKFGDWTPLSPPYTIEAGVGRRRKYAADDWVNPQGEWIYDNTVWPGPPWCHNGDPNCAPGGEPPTEASTVVVQPTGDCAEHFFSASPLFEWTWAYGLPFSQAADDGASRYKSTEVWTQSEPDPTTYKRNTKCAGELLRTRWVDYEKDEIGPIGNENPRDYNQRLRRERTVYEDDEGRFAGVTHSDFDGLGHYRQSITEGDFPGQNVKTTITDYNPDRGTYDPNNPPGTFTMWDEAEPWILGTFVSSSITEGAKTSRTEYCFDWDTVEEYPVTSHLKRRRRLTSTTPGPSRSPDDVLEVFGRTGGNVTRERYYGGDTQAVLGTSDLWELPLPTAPTYRADKEFEFGVLKRQFYFAGGVELFNTYDATPNEATGLPATSRDPSGLETTYAYDDLGRLTLQDPAEEAATTYTYTPAANAGTAGFVPAMVHVERDDAASGSHVENEFLYDGFGRVSLERRLNADGATFAERATAYNARGWKTTVSEWESSAVTTYDNYDAFGRPGTITPPDGASHAVTLAYTGVSRVERTVAIEQGGGETGVPTAETYDRFGRLYRVEEPVGGEAVFTYTYDEADRLAKVEAGPTPASVVQTRKFAYDGRGFLASEIHPEKGASGGGTVTYSLYDARGHVGRMTEDGRILDYAYDDAERLETVTHGTDTIKEFIYDDAPTNGQGKLYQATRLNKGVDIPDFGVTDVIVAETYDYAGVQGRVSSRTTTNTFNDAFTFVHALTYDALGRIQDLDYPVCQGPGCPTDPLTVRQTYGGGYLTQVGTPADPDAFAVIGYHPNGLWSTIDHANGLTTNQTVDENHGMRRPHQIYVSGPVLEGTGFDTGVYSYDGAGNVAAMGSDTFTYDDLSRLETAGVHGYTQIFGYDPYGNLTSVATTPGDTVPIPVDSSTNRLTGAAYDYDGPGNVTLLDGVTYTYDPMNLTINRTGDTSDWAAIYTADDERLAVWATSRGTLQQEWTLRGLDGKVLRQYF